MFADLIQSLEPPEDLFIDDLIWKQAVRAAITGRNVMFCGPSGCGKTVAAMAVQKAVQKLKDEAETPHESFSFNFGSTQRPRASIVGSHVANSGTTSFQLSRFAKAIQNESATILLDEISRGNGEAWNLVLPVLDPVQRRLQVDETGDVLEVGEHVSFVATANQGHAYTSARKIDRALFDRFVVINLEPLSADDEFSLLKSRFGSVPDPKLQTLAKIAEDIREEAKTDMPSVDRIYSTRQNVEAASQLEDGFSLEDVLEINVVQAYSDVGGSSSPRSFVKKVVQLHKTEDTAKDYEDQKEDNRSKDQPASSNYFDNDLGSFSFDKDFDSPISKSSGIVDADKLLNQFNDMILTSRAKKLIKTARISDFDGTSDFSMDSVTTGVSDNDE